MYILCFKHYACLCLTPAIQEVSPTPKSPRHFLTIPGSNNRHTHSSREKVETSPPPFYQRSASTSASSTSSETSLNGVFFALKHWMCKHFYVSL